jgi:enterochelin esterase family protein
VSGTLRAALAALVLAGGARAGELLPDERLASAALGRDLAYAVYLPDAAAGPGARLPVVYLLHGFGADRRQWITGAGLPATLDALIDADVVAPFIAVAPDAGNSWYVDSAARGGAGDYETAIVRDLVAAIDARFPTDPRRESRAIAGLSMGGFGALRLGFRHPGTFGAIAALSPGIWAPGGMSWAKAGFEASPADEMTEWYGGMTGPAFDLGLFAALSPFAELDRLTPATAPAMLIAVGDDDYFELYDGALEMFLALRARGLKPELRVDDGGHDWEYWARVAPEVFRFIDGTFRAAPAAR